MTWARHVIPELDPPREPDPSANADTFEGLVDQAFWALDALIAHPWEPVDEAPAALIDAHVELARLKAAAELASEDE